MSARIATVKRDTLETRIQARVNLDGAGNARLATGLPFLDHMLDQIARHGLIDLDIEAEGDLHIDAHHTVEDIGITLGQAVRQALGEGTFVTATDGNHGRGVAWTAKVLGPDGAELGSLKFQVEIRK